MGKIRPAYAFWVSRIENKGAKERQKKLRTQLNDLLAAPYLWTSVICRIPIPGKVREMSLCIHCAIHLHQLINEFTGEHVEGGELNAEETSICGNLYFQPAITELHCFTRG